MLQEAAESPPQEIFLRTGEIFVSNGLGRAELAARQVMDYLAPASSSEPLYFYSRSLDRAASCSVSDFWTMFTSSAFEALEIQAAFKHIISKANYQKRVDRLSPFRLSLQRKSCVQLFSKFLHYHFALSSTGINLLCLPGTYK